MFKTFIYSLTDPITNQVRYIGKADNIKKRFSSHICLKNLIKPTHKNNWINSLKNKGLKPILNIIDEVPNNEWEFWEQYWISQFRVWGFDLTNLTEGGDTVKVTPKFGENNPNFNSKINDSDILGLIEHGFSQQEIIKRLNTNAALLKRRMDKYGVNFNKLKSIRMSNGETPNFRVDITKEKITNLLNQGFSINKISKILNCDRSTIKKRI